MDIEGVMHQIDYHGSRGWCFMTPNEYLWKILEREHVSSLPVLHAAQALYPDIRRWAGDSLVDIYPSGSYAKGTANKNGADIDLFISISESLSNNLEEIYDSLKDFMVGYNPRMKNVSINVRIKTYGVEYSVDLVPGKRQNPYSQDHSLWVSRTRTWQKTNIQKHIATVRNAGFQKESRIIKLWSHQKRLEFPSFCIELAVIAALQGKNGDIASNVTDVFHWIANNITVVSLIDPANSNNVVSDTLTKAEKTAIKNAATAALMARNWSDVIK